MNDAPKDQAAGLRQIFGLASPRIITFAAGSAGVGKSSLVANLAASLALRGKRVMVLDENIGNRIAAYFGHAAQYDLLHVIRREQSLAEVALDVIHGLRIVPSAQIAKTLVKLNAAEQDILLECLSGNGQPNDIILVDSSADHPLGFSPFGLAAHDTVIVLTVSGASITEAYTLIKKVSLAYAHRKFRIVVNQARNFDEAVSVYGNLAEVAQTHALAHLEYAGFIPLDDSLKQAASLCQPVESVFPDAPAAKVYRQLAMGLCNWLLPEGNAGTLEQFVQKLLNFSQAIDPVAIYA